jgi:hypothetical protein
MTWIGFTAELVKIHIGGFMLLYNRIDIFTTLSDETCETKKYRIIW